MINQSPQVRSALARLATDPTCKPVLDYVNDLYKANVDALINGDITDSEMRTQIGQCRAVAGLINDIYSAANEERAASHKEITREGFALQAAGSPGPIWR